MFCDLVNYTALSEKLDPEDLRDIVRQYQSCCSTIVEQFGGYISRFMGDGILIFFGYPEAHEDDAVRSIRAGLEMVSKIIALNTSRPISARIGIATGIVVAGDLIGEGSAQEMAVVGTTPNIAARLQAIAKPSEVVVSADTQQLAEGMFQFEELGPQQLKGLSDPVLAYRAMAQSESKNPFEARKARGLSPMIGRHRELSILLDRWREAQDGTSQFVLISSEPGMGKSRLIQAFKEQASLKHTTHMNMHCSPFHRASPLHPFIELVEDLSGIEQVDIPEQRQSKLNALLQEIRRPNRKAGEALRLLISSDWRTRGENTQSYHADDQKRLLQGLVDFVAATAEIAPIILVLEDVHWIDPSTLEWLVLLKSSLTKARLMVVITYRTGFLLPVLLEQQSQRLALKRLSRSEASTLIQHQTQGITMPGKVMDRILFQTDGVPLFIEEFTKAVIDSKQLGADVDQNDISNQLSPLTVPTTLKDSLAARLNQKGVAKEVSQLAATIGQDFDLTFLASLCAIGIPQLRLIVDQLIAEGVLIATWPNKAPSYRFKHALLRDAAYHSLLKSQRRGYHEKIADALERRARTHERPEIIAHHHFESGAFAKSTPYWLQAGELAIQHYAHREAVVHFEKGLESIEKAPGRVNQNRMAMKFYLLLGTANVATKGSASDAAENAYRRCLDLSSEQGDFRHQFMATWGLWASAQQSGKIDTAQQLTTELDRLAKESNDSLFALQYHHAGWTTAYRTAEFQNCCHHAEAGAAIYQADHHAASTSLFGNHDPGLCALYHSGMSRWLLGFPDKAAMYKRQISALVDTLNNPASKAITMMYELFLCCQLRDVENALQRANQIQEVCNTHEVAPQCRIAGKIICGWAHSHAGEPMKGLRMMRDGLMEKRRAPARAHEALLQSLFADACIKSGQPEEAKEAVSEAFELVTKTGECTWEAELHRLKGEAFAADGSKESLRIAEQSYLKSATIAQRQQALSLQLRTAQCLAHLRCKQGRLQEAKELLRNLYGQFSEGHSTFDLAQTAKALQTLH
jgi:class 3 adenylate cyclase/predicted ATPase